MQLNITTSIQKQLKEIIDQAVTSGKINPEKLRMIIISPNKTFDVLKVTYNNAWDEYYYGSEYDDASDIGTISISEWLDIADKAFEKREGLDALYIDRAVEHDRKYTKIKPALTFNHISDQLYKSYLTCLREELILQIENAIKKVATSYTQKDFKHVVGFVTHKLTFKQDDNVRILAFNHPNGSDPFYNVMLALPQSKLTYPYLKFYDTGFYLFYPKSNIYEGSEEESNIYTYDIKNIEYGFIQSKHREKATFRLTDEFEDWKLDGGHIEEEEGDLSEEAFFSAFDKFMVQFPDKIIDPSQVPDPIHNESNFTKWLNTIQKHNLDISYKAEEKLYNYGEEAFRKTLEFLPDTNKNYSDLQKFLTARLFSEGRYEESTAILKSIKQLSDHYKVHLLENLYFLNRKEEFDECYASIESKSAKKDALLPKWLFDIKLYQDQRDELNRLKDELISFMSENNGYSSASRAAIALTRLYTILGEKENALYCFQSISFSSDIHNTLFKKEFTDSPYMLQAYDDYLAKEREKEDFKSKVKVSSLVIPETDKQEIEKVPYEDCYYLTHKIEDVDLSWVVPISKNQFIAVNGDKELFIGEITDTYEIIKHTVIALDKEKRYHYSYHNEVVYISDYDKGILRYQIQRNTIIPIEGSIRNTKKVPKYGNLNISDGHLYVCNNEYLEIFDLSNPDANLISSDVFIESGYSLHINDNLLVVGAGAGLVLLLDIKDKSNPTYLSSIIEDKTPGDMHIAFFEHYMVTRSVIDISNPADPKFICHNWDDLAPIYYFSEKPNILLCSTGDEFLFTTLSKEDNGKISLINWLESLNKENLYSERLTYNIATMYDEDTVIGFTKYDICILEKDKNLAQQKQEFDIQDILEKMAIECFEHLVEHHPDFSIGKVVLEHKPDYGVISLSFQECSSPAIVSSFHEESGLSMVYSNFNIYPYFSDTLDMNFDPQLMKMNYDLNRVVDKIISNDSFNTMTSKHVSILINNESRYLEFPDHNWNPYREISSSQDPDTVKDIILSSNDNLIKQLEDRMITEEGVFEELLQLINLKKPEDNTKNILTSSDNHKITSTYIQGPVFQPKQENDDSSVTIQKLKLQALQIITSHTDRKIVRNIMFNGAKYGIPKPVLEKTPNTLNIKEGYVSILVNNGYGLWDEFSEDPEIKAFLLDILDTLNDESLRAKLAYRYKIYSHKSIYNYIKKLLTDTYDVLDYYNYIGDSHRSIINISKLPLVAIRPFEKELLEIFEQFESNTDEKQNHRIKNMIVPVCDMLIRLGHEKFPEELISRANSSKKYNEQYDDDLFDDDYEDEETFILQLYRKQQVKRILQSFEYGKEQPIWNNTIAPEPYKKSWYTTIDLLFEQGEHIYGEDFKNMFIQKLSKNIAKDENYDHDRLLAFNFIHYTYKHIQKRPELASIAETIVEAITSNKDKFSEEIDLYNIKEKSKFALLQAAWNDLKNKDLELAKQKGDAILKIDPEFGQVYFLKARLLWLKEGIPTYLEKQEEYIKKASHDAATLARLYNLTGCALDVEKRYEEALPYFKNAALTATNEPMYLANIAEIYYKLKNPKEALNYVQKAKQNGHSSEMMDEISTNKGIIN
ncbi:hypothetical protein [Aquimarina sp. AU58]|uniref:hypothetical protein n=1 Tax=Aquimarina sp. AU58 TaxID=1874112 RepID=UPI000D6DF5E0|nr:hypothetical protein [Aquimarina sp. AU58]